MAGLGDTPVLVLAAYGLVIALAGLVHGTLGMGFPLVSTPLLALLVDVRSAILLTLLPTVAVNVASVIRGGRWGESIGRFWPLAAYAAAGSVAGSRWLVVSDPAPFKLLLAGLVVLYLVAHRLGSAGLGWTRVHVQASMLVFGLVAGVSAGTTNVMVPILIIYTLEFGLERTATIQVFNLCFLAGKLSQIGVFAGSGLVDGAVISVTAPLAAVALLALGAGMRLRERIPVETYRRIVRWMLAVIAGVLIAQFVMGA